MHNFDIKNPKDKKYFEKRCDLYIFIAVLGLIVFALLMKFGQNMSTDSKFIELSLLIGLASSFFSFIVGLLLHPTYDLVSQEKTWQIEKIKEKDSEVKDYILKVGEQGRTLYNIELDMLYSFYENKALLRQKNNIYHAS